MSFCFTPSTVEIISQSRRVALDFHFFHFFSFFTCLGVHPFLKFAFFFKIKNLKNALKSKKWFFIFLSFYPHYRPLHRGCRWPTRQGLRLIFEKVILHIFFFSNFCSNLPRKILENLDYDAEKQVFSEFRESSFDKKPPNHR